MSVCSATYASEKSCVSSAVSRAMAASTVIAVAA